MEKSFLNISIHAKPDRGDQTATTGIKKATEAAKGHPDEK
tara:strand:+ start:1931 stop:2050 length:120 start_codon:yes stop_codon:yes gene_type:complete